MLLLLKVDVDLVVGREGHVDPLDDHLPALQRDDLVHLRLLQRLAEVVCLVVVLEANVLAAEVVRDDEAGPGRLVAPTTAVLVLGSLDVVFGEARQLTHLLLLGPNELQLIHAEASLGHQSLACLAFLVSRLLLLRLLLLLSGSGVGVGRSGAESRTSQFILQFACAVLAPDDVSEGFLAEHLSVLDHGLRLRSAHLALSVGASRDRVDELLWAAPRPR